MNKGEAAKLKDRPLKKGTLSGDETFIVNHAAFTSPESTLTFLKVHAGDHALTLVNATTGKTIYRDELAVNVATSAQGARAIKRLQEQVQNVTPGASKHVSHARDPDTGELLRQLRRVPGIGFNGDYLYRKTPAFEGQKPEKDIVDVVDGEDNTHLFLYARLHSIPAEGDRTQFTIFSVVIGEDSETPVSGMGYQWKDIYQGIRLSQFEYFTLVVDMQKTVLVKSYEDNTNRLPIFEVGPGVDTDHAICCLIPLLPDGQHLRRFAGKAGKTAINPTRLLFHR